MKKKHISAFLDELTGVEDKLASNTQRHPIAMLAAAAVVGFSIGCFGFKRVFQAGVALNLQDKISLKDLFSAKEKMLAASAESPHAQA